MNQEKIFKDPIYGYISIPEEYCKNFIDTAIFQRLRRIEQTSMRVLYPTARHDRFAHSIGVFYLGQLAFSSLKKNSKDFFSGVIDEADWEVYKKTFEIACLMHDCGHSPFSHTFEHYYLHNKEDEIREQICRFFKDSNGNSEEFSWDYENAASAPHEKISALLLLTHFYEKIKTLNANPTLAARMIMGLRYTHTLNKKNKFENNLISLLNGSGIDVDSLDYIQRDSWVSGAGNVNIDYHRLLSAIMIKPDENDNVNIVFSKKALSVIDNISIGRNFLYKWIYSHHKVIYEQHLLSEIVDNINKQDQFCEKILTLKTFTESTEANNHQYYLPTDDDIIHTIKQHLDGDKMIIEFLSRNYRYKALWKTYFEFNNAHFKNISNDKRMLIYRKIKEGGLNSQYGDDILCLLAQPKLKGINQNDFFIDIDGELVDAAEATQQRSENLTYFIVYVPEDMRSKKSEIIKNILSLRP